MCIRDSFNTLLLKSLRYLYITHAFKAAASYFTMNCWYILLRSILRVKTQGAESLRRLKYVNENIVYPKELPFSKTLTQLYVTYGKVMLLGP